MLSRETFQETFKRLIEEISKIGSIPVLKQKIQSLVEQHQQLLNHQQVALNSSIKRFLLLKDIQAQITECMQRLQQEKLLLQRYEILSPFASSLEKNFLHVLQESQSTQTPFSAAKMKELQLSIATIKSDLLNLLDPYNDLNAQDIDLICKAMLQQLKILKHIQHIEMVDHPFLTSANEKKEWEIGFKLEVKGDAVECVDELENANADFYDAIQFDEEGVSVKNKAPVFAEVAAVSHAASVSSVSSVSSASSASSSASEYLGPILPAAVPIIETPFSEQDKQAGILYAANNLNELKREMLSIKKTYVNKIKKYNNEMTRLEAQNKSLFNEMNSFEILIGSTADQLDNQRKTLQGEMDSNEGTIKDYRDMTDEFNQIVAKMDLFLSLLTNLIYEFKLARSKTLDYNAIANGVKEMGYGLAFFIDNDFTDEDKQNEADIILKLFAILLNKHFPEPVAPVPALNADAILSEEDKFKNTRTALKLITRIKKDLMKAVEKHVNRVSILQLAEVELLAKLDGIQLYFMLNRDLKVRELAEFALNILETDKTKSDYLTSLYLSIYKVDTAVNLLMKERATARWQRLWGSKNANVEAGKFPVISSASAVSESSKRSLLASVLEENFQELNRRRFN